MCLANEQPEFCNLLKRHLGANTQTLKAVLTAVSLFYVSLIAQKAKMRDVAELEKIFGGSL